MYDEFAKFYDRLGWDSYAKELWPDFKRFLDKSGFNIKTMLDLACGTGVFCIGALRDGINVEGLDLSEEMLKKAVENCRKYGYDIKFHLGDMSDFDLGKKFDLITCTFDAINHMTDFQKWKSMFNCVKRHLNEKGIFMFDMNTLKDLSDNWNNIHIRKYPNGDYYISKSISFGDNAFITFTAFLKKEGRLYEEYEETVHEMSFSLDEVVNELKMAGFKSVNIMNRKFDIVEDVDSLDRAFILCNI